MPPNAPLPRDEQRVIVDATSGWKHLTGVMSMNSPRHLHHARQAIAGIRQLTRKAP